MAYFFGSRSKERRDTLDPKLQKLVDRVITMKDFSIVSGHRDEAEQDGIPVRFSGLSWPNSKHNRKPSHAFDFAPFPIHWEDTDEFCVLAGMFMAIAHELGIKVAWGGYWRRLDYGHIELLED